MGSVTLFILCEDVDKFDSGCVILCGGDGLVGKTIKYYVNLFLNYLIFFKIPT